MNIEQVKRSIGKEVEYLGNDPDLLDHCSNTRFLRIVKAYRDGGWYALLESEHGSMYYKIGEIKLTDRPMDLETALERWFKGEKIEALDSVGWSELDGWELGHLKNAKGYRLRPPSVVLNGEYTKENLLLEIEKL